MRVGTQRGGFGLDVGEGRVTLELHIYVELLLDLDFFFNLHKLGEFYSK
jgi:hypothetical protein